MAAGDAQARLDLMLSFRRHMQDFLQARSQMIELTQVDERTYYETALKADQRRARAERLIETFQSARENVARLITEATSISHSSGVSTQIKIAPPPVVGGYIRPYNLFHAAIQDELPYGYELPQQIVADAIDQTIYACERAVRDNPNAIVKTLAKTPRHFAAVVAWLFPSQIQRTIFGWCIVTLSVGLVLRFVFGFHPEEIGKLVVKWVFK